MDLKLTGYYGNQTDRSIIVRNIRKAGKNTIGDYKGKIVYVTSCSVKSFSGTNKSRTILRDIYRSKEI